MADPIDERHLLGHWTHADEEGDGDELVLYAPEHELAPRRAPRASLRIERGGAASAGAPGPADRSVRAPVSWSLDGDVLTVSGSGPLSGRFRVVVADGERLVLRRGP